MKILEFGNGTRRTEIEMPRRVICFGRQFNLVLEMLLSSESRTAKLVDNKFKT